MEILLLKTCKYNSMCISVKGGAFHVLIIGLVDLFNIVSDCEYFNSIKVN